MAESSINVLLRLLGAKQFQKDLRGVTTSLGNLSKSFDRIGASATRVAANFAKIGTAAALAVAAASREFALFEADFTNVVTLLDSASFETGGLQEGIEGLKDGVLELGRETGQSFEALNKGLFDTISAGVAASDSIETLSIASDLAIAGATDVATAVDGITTALGSYSLSASESDKVAQKFFTAQKFGKTTIEELAGSIGLVASTAAASGVSFEELLATVSAATTAGVQTNAAFTGLRGAITNIIKPTADAQLEAERLGVEFNATALRSRGLIGVLNQVTNSANFNENSFSRLFGSVQGLNFAQAVANNNFSTARSILGELNNETKSAETFADALAVKQDTLGFAAGQLQRNFQALVIEIGQAVAPAIRRLIEIIDSLVDRFGPRIVQFFERLGDRVAKFLQNLQNDPDFFVNLEIGIKTALATAKQFFEVTLIPGLRVARDLTLQTVDAVFALGAAFGKTEQETTGFAIAFVALEKLGLVDLFKELGLGAAAFLFVLFQITNFLTGGALIAGITKIRDGFLSLFSKSTAAGVTFRFFMGLLFSFLLRFVALPAIIAVAFLTAFNKMTGSATPFRDAVRDVFNVLTNLPTVIGLTIAAIGDFFANASTILQTFFDTLSTRIVQLAAGITNFLRELPEFIGRVVGDIFEKATRAVLEFVDSFFGDLINISEETINRISETVGEFIGGLAEAITAPIAFILQGITALFTSIGTLISGALSIISQAVADVVNKFFIEPLRDIFNFVKSLADSIARLFGFIKKEQAEVQQNNAEIVNDLNRPIGGTVFGPQLPGFATGGIVKGPGTGTSDSILARLSNGEGIINAAAVKRLGAGFIHAINKGYIPAFANGGVVSGLNNALTSNSIRAIPSIGVVPPAANLGPTGRPITLVLGNGETIEAVTQDQDPARKLQRSLRQKNLNKPGNRPFWY
jgi:TP901 family phage tail tape measure protein